MIAHKKAVKLMQLDRFFTVYTEGSFKNDVVVAASKVNTF
jgi:hypothetical protein